MPTPSAALRPNQHAQRFERRAPVKPYGKHSPAVRKKMLSVVLVGWPTVRGYRPKVFRHYQIGVLTLWVLYG